MSGRRRWGDSGLDREEFAVVEFADEVGRIGYYVLTLQWHRMVLTLQ